VGRGGERERERERMSNSERERGGGIERAQSLWVSPLGILERRQMYSEKIGKMI
jgi:hypothetical protein